MLAHLIDEAAHRAVHHTHQEALRSGRRKPTDDRDVLQRPTVGTCDGANHVAFSLQHVAQRRRAGPEPDDQEPCHAAILWQAHLGAAAGGGPRRPIEESGTSMAAGDTCETLRERLDTTPRDPCTRSCSVAHALAIARCRPATERCSSLSSCQQENTTYENTSAGICQVRSFCWPLPGDVRRACRSSPRVSVLQYHPSRCPSKTLQLTTW
jgi:hypothetical protein